MTLRSVALLSALTFLLAFAPSAFAATNITVVAGGGTVNNSGPPNFTPSGNDSQVGVDLINAQLNSGTNVALNTSSASAQAGTITVSAAINPSTPNGAHLTLTAASTVTLGASITVPVLSVT